jgi:hypothetical protein
MSYYTGIGSRTAPSDILLLMTEAAIWLRIQGWILRSGGADGSDKAFEVGASNRKEIYKPKTFIVDDKLNAPTWAIQTASRQCLEYPFELMKPYVQALIARNMMQVAGLNGDTPSKFVICWTPTMDPCNKDAGGTRYACRFARELSIPIYNLHNSTDRAKIIEKIR